MPYGTVLAFLVVVARAGRADRPRPPHRAGAAAAAARGAGRGRAGLVPWPPAARGARRRVGGLLLALLLLVKVLDLGFNTVFDRHFDPVRDWYYLGPGVGVLGDSIGAGWARVVAVVAGLATLAVLVGVPLAMVRLVRVAAARRRFSLTAATALADRLGALRRHRRAGGRGRAGRVDQRRRARPSTRCSWSAPTSPTGSAFAARDRHRPVRRRRPLAGCWPGCRGKDVLLVFVESYGRVAVQDTSYSAGDRRTCSTTAPRSSTAAGYQSRSAFLTSPTFGAGSWLAHATPAVRAVGRQPAALRPAARRRPADPDRACSAAPAGAPSSTSRPTPRTGPRARTSTASTSTTTRRNVGYRGPEVRLRPHPRPVHARDLPRAAS